MVLNGVTWYSPLFERQAFHGLAWYDFVRERKAFHGMVIILWSCMQKAGIALYGGVLYAKDWHGMV